MGPGERDPEGGEARSRGLDTKHIKSYETRTPTKLLYSEKIAKAARTDLLPALQGEGHRIYLGLHPPSTGQSGW